MRVVVSPYHLTTREAPAMASLLLGEQVVTMVPAPMDGHDRAHVHSAAARVPAYLRFMESWRWSVPLWQAGVVGGAFTGHEPAADVREAYRRIGREEALRALRVLLKPELFESEETYLDAVSRDVLRAGPDPGITVPVAAGLDVFAARHVAVVARAEPTSVVQRAEARLGRRVLSLALPVLLQASAQRILTARVVLGEVLGPLRVALEELAIAATEGGGADAAGDVAIAAREYGVAFADARRELLESPATDADDEEDEVRVVEGTLAITGLVLPADAVLTASLAALRSMSAAEALVGGRAGRGAAEPSSALARGRPVFTLLMKVMGRAGRGGRA